MGWSIYVTLDRPIDRPALGALLHALCAAHPDLLGHGGALGFNEQEWGWSLAVNVAPYDKADRTSTLIQLSGAFAVSGDKAVRFAMLLGEQLVAGGWSPTFKSSDFAISEKVVTAIARVVGLEKLVSRGFNYRCSCGGRLKAKVRSTPAVVAQVTAIIDGVWNKEHAGLGHKTRPGFRAAAVVLAMLIALLGGVPLAIAEKDPCYAACYRKAAPCIGRDACNRKSSGCYDRCDSARSAARDRPPLVCGRARAKVSEGERAFGGKVQDQRGRGDNDAGGVHVGQATVHPALASALTVLSSGEDPMPPRPAPTVQLVLTPSPPDPSPPQELASLAPGKRPVVGRSYLVPCVEVTGKEGFSDLAPGWWPVRLPLHEDGEIIGFPFQHYHLDGRFLTKGQYAGLCHNGFERERLHGVVLRYLDGVEPRRPELRARVMVRVPPVFPRSLRRPYAADNGKPPHWMAALEARHADTSLPPSGRCPHRGIDLSRLPDDPGEPGVVTCPGHGLRWHRPTGRLLVLGCGPCPSPSPTSSTPTAP